MSLEGVPLAVADAAAEAQQQPNNLQDVIEITADTAQDNHVLVLEDETAFLVEDLDDELQLNAGKDSQPQQQLDRLLQLELKPPLDMNFALVL